MCIFCLSDQKIGILYFAVHDAHPCIMHTYVLWELYMGLPYPQACTMSMHNAHPYFVLKNMGKKCTLYKAKYGTMWSWLWSIKHCFPSGTWSSNSLTSPRDSSEMNILRPQPRSTESEILEVRPSPLGISKPSRLFWCMQMFEKYRISKNKAKIKLSLTSQSTVSFSCLRLL